MTVIFIFLILIIYFTLNELSFKYATKKISFEKEYIYIVSRKEPIEIIDKYQDLIRLLSLGGLWVAPKYVLVEKFDIKNGKLINSKKVKLFIGNYELHGFIIDTKTDLEKIRIFPIETLKLLQFNLKDQDNIIFDSAKNIFFSNNKLKMRKLENERNFEEIDMPRPLEQAFNVNDIDNGNALTLYKRFVDEHNEYFYHIFNIDTKTIKEIELNREEWSLHGIKGLKILAHKLFSGDYYFIDLIETENLFQIKNIQKLHHSKFILDDFDWDKKDNKIYFYDSGEAHFQNNFDVFRYEESSLEKKVFHVELKR